MKNKKLDIKTLELVAEENSQLMITMSIADLKEAFRQWQSEFEESCRQQQPVVEEAYLNVGETAKFLGVSKVSIYRWSKCGYIQSYPRGNRLYFKRTELIKFINEK